MITKKEIKNYNKMMKEKLPLLIKRKQIHAIKQYGIQKLIELRGKNENKITKI